MSKIQEALRRIQVRTGEDHADRTEQTSDSSIGEIAEEVDSTGVSLQSPDGGLINIDLEALREAGYLPPKGQARHVAEQYRILKRPLLNNAFGGNEVLGSCANLVMISSALPGDGKTFNCINLALSMAYEKDVSVLLVDADVARPHASRLLGVAERPGLIDLLRDKNVSVTDLTMRTNISGLSVLPAGLPDEQSTELLASKRMKRLVTELSLSNKNRIVIFDSPPVLATSEARVLAAHVGQIAMIVCAGKTPKQAVLDALANFDDTKAINLVLNQVSDGFSMIGYGNYHYGYGHGSD